MFLLFSLLSSFFFFFLSTSSFYFPSSTQLIFLNPFSPFPVLKIQNPSSSSSPPPFPHTSPSTPRLLLIPTYVFPTRSLPNPSPAPWSSKNHLKTPKNSNKTTPKKKRQRIGSELRLRLRFVLRGERFDLI